MCKHTTGVSAIEEFLNITISNASIELAHTNHLLDDTSDMEVDEELDISNSNGYWYGVRKLAEELIEFMRSGYNRQNLPEVVDEDKYSEDNE